VALALGKNVEREHATCSGHALAVTRTFRDFNLNESGSTQYPLAKPLRSPRVNALYYLRSFVTIAKTKPAAGFPFLARQGGAASTVR
jgi:hypothetical protein